MSKILTLLTIFSLLIFSANSSYCQQDIKREFTLEEAQQYAVSNSYATKDASYSVKAAKEKIWESISTGLPQINGSVDYTKNMDIPSVVFNNQTFKMGSDYDIKYGASVNQLIFDGSYIVGLQAAKVYLKISQNAQAKTEIEIRDAVSQAYYMVLISEKIKDNLEENLKVTKKLYEETKAYFEKGFKEETDADQVKLLYKNSEKFYNDAVGQIKVARAVLNFTLGIDIETSILLKDNLMEFINKVNNNVDNTSSVNSHIDYKIVENEKKSNKLLLKNAKAAFLPKLNAFYQIGKSKMTKYANPFNTDEDDWILSSSVGLKLNIPIFHFGYKISKVNQARFDYLKSENKLEQKEQELKRELIVARIEFNNANQKYNNDKESYELSKRIFEKTQMKYKEGVSSSIELSQIHQQYINTHNTYIQTLLGLLQAKIKLQKAIGIF